MTIKKTADMSKSCLGEKNGNAVLTADQVKQIRAEYKPRTWGHGIRVLARKYQVTPASISNISITKHGSKMKVDFDGLRRQTGHSYNRLVAKLKPHIRKDENRILLDSNYDDVSNVLEEMNELRSLIGGFLALTDEPEFTWIDLQLESLLEHFEVDEDF